LYEALKTRISEECMFSLVLFFASEVAFSSKRLFIKTAFHRMAFSSNAQFHLVFKTVSRISVARLHPKLLHLLCLCSSPLWSMGLKSAWAEFSSLEVAE
jgi:hypothetical protein